MPRSAFGAPAHGPVPLCLVGVDLVNVLEVNLALCERYGAAQQASR